MSKWKLFGKSKEEEITEQEITIEEEEKEEEIETTQSLEDEPLVEYSETLITSDTKPKSKKQKIPETDQHIWRDVNLIEEKVDNLHITRAQKPVTQLDKTVDKLIAKRKKK